MSDAKRKIAQGLLGAAQSQTGLLGTPQGPYGPMGSGPALTPQEWNLYRHHLRNLNNLDKGGGFTQPTGEVSTVLQMVVGPIRGKYYNIPSVWNGRQLDQDAAIRQAFGGSGHGPDFWPSYPTPEAADNRYINEMHPLMDRDMQRMQRKRK
jgi:hypothetical protein